VVFCRLTVPLLEDPDYDLIRFRFQWRTTNHVDQSSGENVHTAMVSSVSQHFRLRWP